MWYFEMCRLIRVCLANFKLTNYKGCSVGNLTVIQYMHAQADLRLCYSHIPVPHCWKSYVTAQLFQRQSRHGRKDQESKQSSTTSDPGHNMGK